MSDTPFFTIIIPAYNEERHIGPALESLLAQTDADWEAVIVDDGSTDGTGAMLDGYAAREPRFRVFHQPNGGTAVALNAALSHARGEWVCWLSADDLFLPEKLAIHRRAIAHYLACRFFHSDYRLLNDETGELTDSPPRERDDAPAGYLLDALLGNAIQGNSICIHRESWQRVGDFNPALRFAHDYEMWLRLAAVHLPRYLPTRTCINRCHPGQETARFFQACWYDSARASLDFVNAHPFPELVPTLDLADPRQARWAVVKALENAHYRRAHCYTLGPQLALVQRVIEWAWDDRHPAAAPLRPLIRRMLARRAVLLDLPWQAARWRAMAAALAKQTGPYTYTPCDWQTLAIAYLDTLLLTDDPRAVPVARYLQRTLPPALLPPEPLPGAVREIVLVVGEATPAARQRGVALAAQFQRLGRGVLLAYAGQSGLAEVDGVLCLGMPDAGSLRRLLPRLLPIDTLLVVGGAEWPGAPARRRLYVLPEIAATHDIPLNALCHGNVPIACGSEEVADTLRQAGMPRGLLSVMPCEAEALLAAVEAQSPRARALPDRLALLERQGDRLAAFGWRLRHRLARATGWRP